MKYYETHYEEYLLAIDKYNLHPELNQIINSLPNKIQQIENIIIYGPPGSGKYSQVLKILKKYSPSELKYEKKITAFNKLILYFATLHTGYDTMLTTIIEIIIINSDIKFFIFNILINNYPSFFLPIVKKSFKQRRF